MDNLIKENVDIKKLVSISSGASIKAYKGIGAYCLLKSCLNMLISIYAFEHKIFTFV